VRALRHALAAAVVVDAGLGLPLLVAPGPLIASLGLIGHRETTLRIVGLLLITLAGCVGYAAHDPFRYVGNLIVSMAGRAAGACLLLLGSLATARPAPFVALGLIQLVLAVLQAWLGRDLFRGPRPR
jgi:hypothetical protein